uniref:Uncharacterized protein n=1 Tax=Anguilla anguilla TaxID=7936 RepID=A0A0E9TYG7_ANGAN
MLRYLTPYQHIRAVPYSRSGK